MNVLSADALGIRPTEHKALLEVRGLFANNVFHHDPDVDLEKPDGFNMNVSFEQGSCGTTACIGGWMFEAMRRDRTAPCHNAHSYLTYHSSDALGPLFWPFKNRNGTEVLDWTGDTYDFPPDLIPPAYALAAIDNFLATGDPDWPAACQLKPKLEKHFA